MAAASPPLLPQMASESLACQEFRSKPSTVLGKGKTGDSCSSAESASERLASRYMQAITNTAESGDAFEPGTPVSGPTFGNTSGKGEGQALPLYAYFLCDPRLWNEQLVMRWLEECVFADKRANRKDLEYYKRKFVQEEGERLVGDDLGHLMLADYMARWGYSAPVVFDYALEALYSFGPKASSGMSISDVWSSIQMLRPIETSTAGQRHHARNDAIQRRPTLLPVPEIEDEDDAMDIENISSPIDSDISTPGEGEKTEDSSSDKGSSSSLSSTDYTVERSVGMRKNPGTAGIVQDLMDVVSMEPICQFKHVPGICVDSDYYSQQIRSSPSTSHGSGSSDTHGSPCSHSSHSSGNATDSPKSSGSGLKKTRRRPCRQRCQLPPLLKFPESNSGGSVLLWQYLLELLADPSKYGKIIEWKNFSSGMFVLKDSEVVATLWGLYRQKAKMNYDKMSRALRYYYGKNVNRVQGSRLTYQYLPVTNWKTYQKRAIGYDHQYVGNQSLVGHGRISRRKSRASSSEGE